MGLVDEDVEGGSCVAQGLGKVSRGCVEVKLAI